MSQERQNLLRRLISHAGIARYPNATIASHSLKPWGRVAGKVDGWDQGWLRGWIYDANRPENILKLDVFVNGKPVLQTIADQYRDDLAALLGDNGIHGFEAFVPELSTPQAGVRDVTLRVTDRPKHVLGPVRVDPLPVAPKELSRDGLVSGSLDDRLRHIFNHITSTHENGLRRLDDVQATLGKTMLALDRNGSGSGRTLLEQTAISGVGQFKATLPDAIEQALLERGIENAIQARNAR